ncbi:AraC family transcriptional regulator [Kriegella aquimaris]|uniref:AraC-type DNA-binding protein n=1 Tax=Kriegella aquimaris TaxID=192904 RepID=A0A1G9RMM8_9FLAO|nr:helix-turn-helix transcriptional regulator [Kriegella aquimaris]SDM24187.1 AraC-type DNA-binding protein [Kriegella aquimaris]
MNSDIQKYGFKEGLPQEFEIVKLAELFQDFSKDLTSPHRTEFYQIIWFQKGTRTHMVDFNPISIKHNTLLFLDKNSVQCFDDKAAMDGIVLLFTDSFFCKSEADTKFLRSSFLFNDLHSISTIEARELTPIFANFFRLMEIELKNPLDHYQSDILRNYLQNFLLLAERERKNQNSTTVYKGADLECVIRFRDLLDQQFQEQKSVSKYAVQMNITQKRLNLATLKVMDVTPKQMIDSRVLLEAKRLLVHTSDSVKQVGFKLGFEEPTNFVKYFRKHHKVTPTEFRNGFLG